MKHFLSTIFVLFMAQSIQLSAQPDVVMLFTEPAPHFTASAPVGNGRLGAMVFGNPNTERIVLNEKSMWSGGIEDPNDYNAYKYLPEIQKLLLDGKNIEAQAMLQDHFVCAKKGSGGGAGAKTKFGCYQILGDLFINWKDTLLPVSNYQRTLRLDSAYCTTTWKRDGVQYTQQVFSSAPQQAIVVRLSASESGRLSFVTGLSRKERAEIKVNGKQIEMTGTLNGGNGDKGIDYAAVMKIVPIGGVAVIKDNMVVVQNAKECLLIITARTNMNWPDITAIRKSPLPVAQKEADKAVSLKWNKLFENHVKDYTSFFNRSRISFTSDVQKYTDSVSNLSVKQRLMRLKEGHVDPALVSLYYNFGRYLLISSSRQGELPANLQGIWAEEYQTPWNGDYHLNINLQMNYWLAESTNLSDCHEPYFRIIEQMAKYGKVTAKAYYNSDGWVAHMITNPWGFTAPGENASWGSTLTGGCWSVAHIWQHYLYTKDISFLKKYYPIIKASAKFYTDILIEEPTHKWLVTAPSNSPENSYVLPNGEQGQTCMGPTMDMQIGRELLEAVIEASKTLNVDADLRTKLIDIRRRLAPNQISSATGRVQEWLVDYKEAEPQHRHVSHLYGLYPYDEITPWDTPDMAQAATKTLKVRGDGGTGWSKAWKVAFWARLGDGDHTYKMLCELFNPVAIADQQLRNGSGTYPNLFCAHPPFQIDGNFGATAGIAEMLLQSHGKEEVIRLIPALPTLPAMASGKAKGLCARGGFVVDFEWANCKVQQAYITSKVGGVCKVALPANSYSVKDSNGKEVVLQQSANEEIVFNTMKGKAYTIVNK